MNYFFGINSDIIKSKLTIPKFQNRSPNTNKDIKLFKCYPDNNEWKVEEIYKDTNSNYKNNFFILNDLEIVNNEIYFLATKNDLLKFDKYKLEDYNDFTNTIPDFRANLEIYFSDKNKLGFSSYQSEYPFKMIKIKGSILSSVSSIANKEADKNYILLKNIFEKPVQQIFNGYLVDIKQKIILEKYNLKTNYSNLLTINNNFIKPEVYFITDQFLGIPVYISEKNGHLSMEHTHPPHTHILTQNRYKVVKNLKEEINEIIN